MLCDGRPLRWLRSADVIAGHRQTSEARRATLVGNRSSSMSAMPAVDAKVVATFERFAARECGDEPLYAAMCRIAIAEPAVLSLMDAAPKEQRRPNLLLAAVQYLLLR